jgi:antitoxin component of MazEF toxin-antitoxin module
MNPYKIPRKLQEQSGSYFVVLPKFVIDAWKLGQGDEVTLLLRAGDIVILSPEHANAGQESP